MADLCPRSLFVAVLLGWVRVRLSVAVLEMVKERDLEKTLVAVTL
jgi:hypothetical protein